MTDFPNSPMPSVISSFHDWAVGRAFRHVGNQGAANGVNWPSANLGIFVPFTLPVPFLVKRFFSANGSAAGNLDIGVFGIDGSKIISLGSTAMSGNTIQIITSATLVLLPPGDYYMALACSSTSAQITRNNAGANALKHMGVLQAASQIPLTTSPTFASTGQAFLPLFGIASVTVL